jgi:hypothetical protein
MDLTALFLSRVQFASTVLRLAAAGLPVMP